MPCFLILHLVNDRLRGEFGGGRKYREGHERDAMVTKLSVGNLIPTARKGEDTEQLALYCIINPRAAFPIKNTSFL